jgi:hypothetical protein
MDLATGMSDIKLKSCRPLRGLTFFLAFVPGFASLTPGFMPPSAPRTLYD